MTQFVHSHYQSSSLSRCGYRSSFKQFYSDLFPTGRHSFFSDSIFEERQLYFKIMTRSRRESPFEWDGYECGRFMGALIAYCSDVCSLLYRLGLFWCSAMSDMDVNAASRQGNKGTDSKGSLITRRRHGTSGKNRVSIVINCGN